MQGVEGIEVVSRCPVNVTKAYRVCTDIGQAVIGSFSSQRQGWCSDVLLLYHKDKGESPSQVTLDYTYTARTANAIVVEYVSATV